MTTTFIVGIIAVLLAWLESYKNERNGLKLSLFVVFLFLALRYDFGNDYMNYLDFFLNINKYPSLDFSDFIESHFEVGWIFLNRLFAHIGFFSMTAALAAFNCFVLYRFIKKYVPQEYYWFAIFYYVFQSQNMLVLSSAMRQAVATSLFLLAIDFLYSKKFIYYLLIVYLATLFHTSAYFLFLLVLLNIVNWRITIPIIIATVMLFAFSFYFRAQIQPQITNLIISYISVYEPYTEGISISITSIGLGIFLYAFIMLVVFYYAPRQKNEKLLLFKIGIISFLLVSFGFSILMIARLNLYLQLVFMAIYPIVFASIKNDLLRHLYIATIILFILNQFFEFFQSDIWREDFSVYHTIFSSLSIN